MTKQPTVTEHSAGNRETFEALPVSPWDQPFFGTFAIVFIVFLVVWIYCIPGYVAWRDGVLSPSGVARHLKGEAAVQWEGYLHRREENQERIRALDSQVLTGSKLAQDLTAIAALREQYKSEMNANPPLILVGMVGNWLNEIWALSYLTLGCLLALWAYPPIKLRWPRILGWSFILYVLSFIQLWARNHILTTPSLGRTTFYWVSWDMSTTSYILQDIRQYIMFVLICIFWELGNQRLFFLRKVFERKSRRPDNAAGRLADAVLILRRAQTVWQASTVLLLIVFVPWSYFYWNQIVVNKDARYLPAVLMIDLIWIVTFFISSRPLFLAMHWWNEEKLSAITTWTGDQSQLSALLAEGSTSSELQVMAASLAGAGSLLFPLIKTLL